MGGICLKVCYREGCRHYDSESILLSPTLLNGNLPLFMDPFADAKCINITLAGHSSSAGITNVLASTES